MKICTYFIDVVKFVMNEMRYIMTTKRNCMQERPKKDVVQLNGGIIISNMTINYIPEKKVTEE